MSDLSPAEKAAVEVIETCPDDLVSDEELARRVVAAVRPVILTEVFRAQAKRFLEFADGAASRADWEFAAELMESLAKSVEEGSPNV